MGEDPSGKNQRFKDVQDIFITSHPSNVYAENLIEIKNINNDDFLGNLAIAESDYPFANDQIERMYGMSIKVQKISDPKDKSKHLGFEVTVLDIPIMSSLTHQTDIPIPKSVVRSFKFLKNVTSGELLQFQSVYEF